MDPAEEMDNQEVQEDPQAAQEELQELQEEDCLQTTTVHLAFHHHHMLTTHDVHNDKT